MGREKEGERIEERFIHTAISTATVFGHRACVRVCVCVFWLNDESKKVFSAVGYDDLSQSHIKFLRRVMHLNRCIDRPIH